MVEADRPSKAANGLETGLGACFACGCGAWARARNAALGSASLAAGAAIEPVVAGWALGAGRGVGSGTLWANAGAVVRQANKAAIATLRPVRAVKCSAIIISASRPHVSRVDIGAGCGYFAALPVSLIRGLIAN